jgi:hypothetical protein
VPVVPGTAEGAIEPLRWASSRWFLTPLALGTGAFLQCIASITSDGDTNRTPPIAHATYRKGVRNQLDR